MSSRGGCEPMVAAWWLPGNLSRVYRMVPELLQVRPEQAMMVASHPYDLSAAANEGMRTAFVKRPQEWGTGKIEAPDFPVDVTAEDFNDLASQLGA